MLRNPNRSLMLLLFWVLSAIPIGCDSEVGTKSLEYPAKPIKVIVPFEPGGGSDTLARIIQQAVEDNQLLPQPFVIINVPGAGATVGSRRVKNARPDGYTILLLHEAILTAKYSGAVTYGPEAFELIAGTGAVGLVLAVAEDSPYETLEDLLDAATENPESIQFSANLGAPVHFVGLMFEKEKPGCKFRYIQHGGGTKRFAALKGGHADISAFSVAEYTQFKEGGLRPLVYCGEESHPAVDAPTARQLGYDVIHRNVALWFAPKGTDPERVDTLGDALERALRTPQVLEQFKKLSYDPIVLRGQEIQDELDDRTERIAAVAQLPDLDLPNIPGIVAGCVALLSLIVLLQSMASGRVRSVATTESSDESSILTDNDLARLSGALTLTVLYVAVMQLEWVGFRIATALFVLCLGWLLLRGEAERSRSSLIGLLTLALVLSVGLHTLMTRVFVIDLP